MTDKKLPFNKAQMEKIIEKFPTPFHIYDEKDIRHRARALRQAFSWNEGYKEYYAGKACPNPIIMSILRDEGCGMDCSSYAELMLCEAIGVTGDGIMFSSNDTPAEDFEYARRLNATINLDDITHIARRHTRNHILPLQSRRRVPHRHRHNGQPCGREIRLHPRTAYRRL